MPRPFRIEYPNAFYHVMNRGKGRQMIFHSDRYYLEFLLTIKEAYQSFGLIVHCYCLMGNHYHLLVETPNANISRIMRHINGVYTQRYNKLSKTDGPLFRGRFKSVIVDSDAYLLNLSRYIHNNPKIFNIPVEQYRWSSCKEYFGLSKKPDWLNIDKTLCMLGSQDYRDFMDEREDTFITEFYSKKKLDKILGSDLFKRKILLAALENGQADQIDKIQQERLSITDIINIVSKTLGVDLHNVREKQLGRRQKNFSRRFAMYLCKRYSGYKLEEICKEFNIASINSASNLISRARHELISGEYKKEYNRIKEICSWKT